MVPVTCSPNPNELQGETLEVELESLLRVRFPRDMIEPVPKGISGGEALQRVRGYTGESSGTISGKPSVRKRGTRAGLRMCGASPANDRCAVRGAAVRRLRFVAGRPVAARYGRRRIEDDDRSEAWWPRLYSFAIGLKGSPDLGFGCMVFDGRRVAGQPLT